jgi:hypothetical protein
MNIPLAVGYEAEQLPNNKAVTIPPHIMNQQQNFNGKTELKIGAKLC